MRFTYTGGIVLFLVLLVLVNAGDAGELGTLTMDNFLSSTKYDYSLENHQELLDYLETASSSTPYIDKIEIRSSSQDFLLEKQKYALRFYTKGWGETKFNNMLTESIGEAFAVEHEVYYCKALRKRYTLILEYLESINHLRVMHELQAVYGDRINVLKQQTGNLSFDVGEYIRAESKYTELQLDLVKIENKLTGLIHKIHLISDSDAKISFTDDKLIEVEEIVSTLSNLKIISDPENIYLRDRKNKIERARIKYDIEKSQDRDYLSYVQLEYDRDNYTKPNRAFSIDFGIKLPFIRSDQEDINRRKVNYIEEKLNYEDEIRDATERNKSTLRSLNRYIDQYNILANKKASGDAQNPLDMYMKMEGINPLSLLEIRESIIRNDLQRNQIYFSILYNYVELLDLLGSLSEEPLRNHISKARERINER
ncbi:MAG: hypothetical protein HN590_06650 [Calditrichaeota bacterium]|nr:hypothetical protein [Calditrichota bacterium]